MMHAKKFIKYDEIFTIKKKTQQQQYKLLLTQKTIFLQFT